MRTLKSPEALEGNFVRLRLAQEADAEFMLALRNNPKKAKCFCSTVSNDIEKQKAFIRKCLDSDNEYLFIIENKLNKNLGFISIYNIIGNSFTSGRWAMCDDSLFEETIEGAFLFDNYAFNVLNLENNFSDVLKTNKKLLKFHSIKGADKINEDEKEIFFLYKKNTFNDKKYKIIDFLYFNGEQIK